MRYSKGLIVGVIFALGLAGWGVNELLTGGGGPVQSQGIAARGFTLQNSQGRPVSLNDYRGKPVLLNFWATWCPPCLEELPGLLRLAEWARKEHGVETLALSVDDGWPTIEKFFAEKKLWPRKDLPFTILLDTNGAVASSYGTTRYPETYFIDRSSKVIQKFVGVQDWTSQEIMKWIAEHSR